VNPSNAEERRALRASWRVERMAEGDAEADADARFWLTIPIDQRAQAVWELSLEAWSILDPDVLDEPGLCRSVARVVRSGR
jgi:hypothetical protein